MALPPDALERDELWGEVELVRSRLSAALDRLTTLRAARLPELRAKAEIASALLRESGHDVSEGQRVGLALSLAEDVAGFAHRKRGGGKQPLVDPC